jgi:hypothetical protein
MKRFLVFICLYPLFATAVFYALLAYESGKEPDRLGAFLLAACFIAAVVPALILAAVDSFMSEAAGRAGSIGTTLVGYGLVLLAASFFWKQLPDFVYVLGLVGAIPAEVCSWLSGRTA